MPLAAMWVAPAVALAAQFGSMEVNEPAQSTDARVVLSLDRPAFLLGEPVLLHYCVENVSSRPFSIVMGGDSRGASRSTRFKVTVTNSAGATMPDPDPSGFHFGGVVVTPTIAPGGRHCQSLALMRHARVDAAGTYSIRATHDLGWKSITPPEGQTTVRLTMPTALEADRIVTTTLGLPTLEVYGSDRIVTPRRDFSVLRYPVYLGPLVRLAEGGQVDALAGIGAIPTTEATRALIALMQHSNHDLARSASQQLAMRLPDPALDGRLPRRGPFNNELEDPRRYLRDAGWRAALATEVRRVATAWLASEDASLVIQAAFMIEAVGTVDDASSLSRALERALERTLTLPFETGSYPRPRGAMQELMRAADVLVSLGYVPPAAPATPGEAALWLTAFGKGARPAGWQATFGGLLAYRIPYIRELSLRHLPVSPPDDLLAGVGPALQHADVDVKIAALEAISRLMLTGHEPRVASIVRTAKETQLLNFACNALHVTGGSTTVYDILVTRLTEPDMFTEAMSRLFGVLQVAGWGGGPVSEEVKATLAERWKTFLAAHRTQIAAGQRFSIDDPAAAGLIPPGWNVRPLR